MRSVRRSNGLIEGLWVTNSEITRWAHPRRWKAITTVLSLVLFQCINSNLVQHVLELVLYALFFLLICALLTPFYLCGRET
jgi:hypothetical protein